MTASTFAPSPYAARIIGIAALLSSLALLAGCASVAAQGGAATDPPPAATPRPAPPAGAAAPTPGQPRAFADVTKEAKESPGFFRTWQKDDKVWLEIAPDQFDVPFFFQVTQPGGVGERRVYGGMMGQSHVVRWRKVGQNVQLIAANTQFTAAKGSPIARAVADGYSDSLLGNTAVASQPHPDRKSVLVELNGILLADHAAGSYFSYGVHQRGYSFDARNSSIERVRVTDDMVSVLVNAHYANPKAALPPAPTAGPTPPNPFPPFENLPDRRSLFLGLQFSLAKLPEPMRPRVADPRIGHFTDEVWDYSDDVARTPRKNLVQRWRLTKKDPSSALSEPVKPIVFWIDRNVPQKYRDAVRAGILEWNKAFAKVGYKDALRVEVQPDDADWSTADAQHATVRWFVGTDTGFAIGPSRTDPRTGEILDADVAIPDAWARGDRRFVREDLSHAGAWPATVAEHAAHGLDPHACTFASEALAETQFGLDLLAERGEIAADSPEAESFVQSSIKAVVMHEVGHALGLRHNFRSSTAYPLEKLADPEFTSVHGLAGSVMDYTPINLALAGDRQGEYHQSTLGPYDYWAIEYAYAPVDPAAEAQELARIAARGASDPALVFSSDPEAAAGIDPATSQFDIGSDPLAYLQRRMKLTRELWSRLQDRKLVDGQPYDMLRRSFDSGFRQTVRAAQLVSKYIAGVHYVRDFAGSSRLPLTPVAPAEQRAALKVLADEIFSASSFRFSPAFMQRMGYDYLQQTDATSFNPDFSLTTRVLSLQAGALGQLLHDSVAARLLDSEHKVASPKDALGLSELYATLRRAIWSELRTGEDIPLIRRNLQREHVGRVAGALLRPSASMPADARALLRIEATTLRGEIVAAQRGSARSPEARAHLAQAVATLDEALKAPVFRTTL